MCPISYLYIYNIIYNITSIVFNPRGGPSSEAQQNKIINHIQEPGTCRGHHQFKGEKKF